MNSETIIINKQTWDEEAERFFGRNPLPEYGPLAPTEEDIMLFDHIQGKKVLDIGCGSGHSLLYMHNKGADELWGLDLSKTQIHTAEKVLSNCPSVQLFEAPMEANPGLPENYFDIAYSIYAIGWTTNLQQTIMNIHSYLKPGGAFIFSWEHPLYNRVKQAGTELLFQHSYHEEGFYDHEAWKKPAIMQQIKLSTYINTLIDNGFIIEKVIEEVRMSEADVEKHQNRWYSDKKAKSIPTTLIIKCRKSN
ncbi:class I SAM-dependent methyltransferase [Bacillus sp. CRN 9]|uniref:class I SAM-dependent methyltransferase n=1 Tax=Cytobacillus horneckiae TaxID=549687 RepID=UPI001561AEB8|nr:methyltransferase domain-containing protein [Bacillus sp. CRN 9]